LRSEYPIMTQSEAFAARSFFVRLALAAGMVLFVALLSRAGGPKNVAGTSYFQASATGQPLVWTQGAITYYTDQGDLSPLLPNASANDFVAAVFSVWTSVPTAAITATSGGELAEDVNGTNVYLNSGGTITMPADIQPTAIGTPVGIVYDYDGSVTDALLGSGAGDSSQCFFNAVYGGDDNYSPQGTYLHALIVMNGQCALTNSQLDDVDYRLERVIGSVLGMGWSQVNPNVETGMPPATPADYAGFPVMHFTDPVDCVPMTLCYPDPYQLAMDDVASLSRLYPITAQNQSSFPGSQIFSAVTARIYGSVWFTDANGNETQPMQGVNVVARWIDSSTGLPSGQYVDSAVSGFLFTGDAGNPITGFDDALGEALSEWGSTSSTVEGFYDLAGLQPPNGNSAQYQLTVEGLDPTWSYGVGPYSPGPVAPSGVAQPITVTVTVGNEVEQDILMGGSTQPMPPSASTWTAPAAVPLAGSWEALLSGYGDMPYFLLAAQANRTLSVAVTALGETGASEVKAQPVIGMWAASDPVGTAPPAFTSSPFNQIVYGMTRLDAQVSTSSNFLIGVSDVRGDGRPDYVYDAYVLYADSVSPARVSVTGGAVTVAGTGFYTGLTAAVGNTTTTPLAVSAGQMILAAPPFSDGPQNIAISDPVSGGSSVMTAVLTYGAAASDTLILLRGLNPSTAIGTQAANPVSVRVLASDGITPVSGATIGWTAGNGVQLSVCGGVSSCSVVTDQSGDAATWLTPTAVGVTTITATLAPGVYSPTQSVSATLNATESASDIGVLTPNLYIAQGATVSLPLTARVMSNGVAQNGVTVNFNVVNGSGTLSAASAATSSSGYATVTLTLTQIAAYVQVVACLAPANAPCQTFYEYPVALAQQNLQPVSGGVQVSTGQAFQPVVVQVTDSASPPDPVIAASVAFQTTVLRPGGTTSTGSGGETNPGNSAIPVILQVSQSNAISDSNGLASLVPSDGGFSAPVEVDVAITAGTSAWISDPLQVLAAFASGSSAGGKLPSTGPLPVGIRRPVEIDKE
jgi:hypothetical protein